MALALRPDSILPTIKCSTCGNNIDMAALVDHVCAGSTGSRRQSEAKSEHSNPSLAEAQGQSQSVGLLGRLASRRTPAPRNLRPQHGQDFGRPVPPPKNDSASANHQIPRPAPLTLSNHTRAFDESPHSPLGEPKTPGSRSFASSTRSGRNVRPSPPSPQMSLGYDNPFPPWPSSPAVETHHVHLPRNQESDLRDLASDQRWLSETAPPKPASNQTVMKRMNTIAKGPFNPRSAANATRSEPATKQEGHFGHKRNNTGDSLPTFRNQQDAKIPERPSTSHTNKPVRSIYTEISEQNPYGTMNPYATEASVPDSRPLEPQPPLRPARPSEDIDRFLAQLQDDNVAHKPAAPIRANTFPEDNSASSSARLTQDVDPRGAQTESLVRSRSLRTQPRRDVRLNGAPPVPRLPGLQTQFPGIASGHSPTDSAGSGHSMFSSNSSQSSRSSPPDSDVESWSRRPSDASVKPDGSSFQNDRDGNNSGRSPRSRPEPILPHSRQRSRTMNGPSPPPFRAAGRKGSADTTAHFDPAVQPGIFDTGRPPSDSAVNKAPLGLNDAPLPKPMEEPRTWEQDQTPSAIRRHPTSASRSPCRGCGTPILGKSLKAADGRLTGRWHKECFVCKICISPFPTGDFYVIRDEPYCERHYHSLNGSLCGACDGGIEGQYLETDQGKKFHKMCFTCDVCDIPLRDEYYELSGKQYCERHAWAVAQRNGGMGPGPGGRGYKGSGLASGRGMLEKRSTRLMMM